MSDSLVKKRLFVGGLSHDVTEKELQDRLSRFGQVSNLTMKRKTDDDGYHIKAFAHLDIEATEESVKKCFKTYQNARWKGSVMKLQEARENVLEKLALEREEAKNKPSAEEEAEKKRKNKKKMEEWQPPDFKQIVGAPVPGTPIPGKKDWVVGKYGRVVPVLTVKKSYKIKAIKHDPSKYCHAAKVFKDDASTDEVISKVDTNKLTWEMDVPVTKNAKKRRGQFSPPPVSKKITPFPAHLLNTNTENSYWTCRRGKDSKAMGGDKIIPSTNDNSGITADGLEIVKPTRGRSSGDTSVANKPCEKTTARSRFDSDYESDGDDFSGIKDDKVTSKPQTILSVITTDTESSDISQKEKSSVSKSKKTLSNGVNNTDSSQEQNINVSDGINNKKKKSKLLSDTDVNVNKSKRKRDMDDESSGEEEESIDVKNSKTKSGATAKRVCLDNNEDDDSDDEEEEVDSSAGESETSVQQDSNSENSDSDSGDSEPEMQSIADNNASADGSSDSNNEVEEGSDSNMSDESSSDDITAPIPKFKGIGSLVKLKQQKQCKTSVLPASNSENGDSNSDDSDPESQSVEEDGSDDTSNESENSEVGDDSDASSSTDVTTPIPKFKGIGSLVTLDSGRKTLVSPKKKDKTGKVKDNKVEQKNKQCEDSPVKENKAKNNEDSPTKLPASSSKTEPLQSDDKVDHRNVNKHKEDNAKRLQAMQQQVQIRQRRKDQMKLALKNVDTASTKRIVFSSSEEEDEEIEMNNSKKAKKSLKDSPIDETHSSGKGKEKSQSSFDLLGGSSEDSGSEEEDVEAMFESKPQFEGKKGEKLMAMQKRFGDSRFKLDAKFIDSDDDDSENEEEKRQVATNVGLQQTEGEEGASLAKEKQRNLQVLESVVGKNKVERLTAKLKRDTIKMVDMSQVRFDPTKISLPEPEKESSPVKSVGEKTLFDSEEEQSSKEEEDEATEAAAKVPQSNKSKVTLSDSLVDMLKSKDKHKEDDSQAASNSGSFSLLDMFDSSKTNNEEDDDFTQQVSKLKLDKLATKSEKSSDVMDTEKASLVERFDTKRVFKPVFEAFRNLEKSDDEGEDSDDSDDGEDKGQHSGNANNETTLIRERPRFDPVLEEDNALKDAGRVDVRFNKQEWLDRFSEIRHDLLMMCKKRYKDARRRKRVEDEQNRKKSMLKRTGKGAVWWKKK